MRNLSSGLSGGEPMKCPSCQHIIPDTVNYCAYCGAKVEKTIGGST